MKHLLSKLHTIQRVYSSRSCFQALRRKSTKLTPNYGSLFTHDQMDIKFAFSPDPKVIEKPVDKDDPNLMYQYWPRCLQFEVPTETDITEEFLKWCLLAFPDANPKLRYRHFEWPGLDMYINGFEPNYQKRLIALKVLEVATIIDDYTEKLLDSPDPEGFQFGIKWLNNCRNIITGRFNHLVNVDQYKEKYPYHYETYKVVEGMYTSCRHDFVKHLSPKTLFTFTDHADLAYDMQIREAHLWQALKAKKVHAPDIEFNTIKPMSHIIVMTQWPLLNDEDVDFFGRWNFFPYFTNNFTAVSNEIWSWPKEEDYFVPLSRIQKLIASGMSEYDAIVNRLITRNRLMKALEAAYAIVPDYQRSSAMKCCWMMMGWEVNMATGSRYMWSDVNDLMYPKIPKLPNFDFLKGSNIQTKISSTQRHFINQQIKEQ